MQKYPQSPYPVVSSKLIKLVGKKEEAAKLESFAQVHHPELWQLMKGGDGFPAWWKFGKMLFGQRWTEQEDDEVYYYDEAYEAVYEPTPDYAFEDQDDNYEPREWDEFHEYLSCYCRGLDSYHLNLVVKGIMSKLDRAGMTVEQVAVHPWRDMFLESDIYFEYQMDYDQRLEDKYWQEARAWEQERDQERDYDWYQTGY